MGSVLSKLVPQRWFGSTPSQDRSVGHKTISDGWSTDMEQRTEVFQTIPGMLPAERGMVLYSLAYGNGLAGDIAEIGSWQGRSTCFLAQACRDTGNGIVRAIDHFQGTPGNKNHYRVDRPDLSDLESNFIRNIDRVGLANYIRLYRMTSEQAFRQRSHDFRRLRMLFIDGDHSYDSVVRDINLFAPCLLPGGVVVLDDYHSDGPGVVRAVRDRVLSTGAFACFTQVGGIFVARKQPDAQSHLIQEAAAA